MCAHELTGFTVHPAGAHYGSDRFHRTGADVCGAILPLARSVVSVWNLCDLICSLLRRPVRLFPTPLGLLRVIAALTGKSAEFKRLCGSLVIDMSDTRVRLDWAPPVTLEQGLDRTARWYLRETRAGSQL